MAGEQEDNPAEGLDNAGWSTPAPEKLPEPTSWPFLMALGVTFLLFGVVTSYLFSAVGFLLMIVSITGWIGEVVHADGR